MTQQRSAMSKASTLMMWVAVALLIVVYFAPLWTIHLQAPQYPHGLGLLIWIDEISGLGPHDLQNINGLNHYIGMHKIVPDAIPELRYMKFFLAGLIAFGALVALARRRPLLALWVGVAVVLAAMGMYDFWKWEYNYGHELDPSAAIKIPGMSYQPPMFGTKQMLNFRATAWPGIGGLAAMLAVALGVLALALEILRNRRPRVRPVTGTQSGATVRVTAAVVAIALFGPGCNRAPQPIQYGDDACAHCLMTISDQRYGAEVVTAKGRTYKYDSIECLIYDLREGDDITSDDVAHVYVTDFGSPHAFVDATAAFFLRSRQLPSPMGGFLTAFAVRDVAESVQRERGGELHAWQEVASLLEK